jgi:hypothetical protein
MVEDVADFVFKGFELAFFDGHGWDWLVMD